MPKSATTKWREVNRSINQMIQSSSSESEHDIINSEHMYEEENYVNDSFTNKENSSYNYISSTETEGNSIEGHLENTNESSLRQELAIWATSNSCTRTCVAELLAILHKHGHGDELPKDARTLLQTPRKVVATEKCNGEYYYFGLEKGIVQCIIQNSFSGDKIELVVNTDGVPIFKSTNVQLWPILCKFHFFNPFLVALYCGNSKPSSPDDFFCDFLEEYSRLKESGVTVNGVVFNVRLLFFTCDAPARQFLKCVKEHSGFYSCERCEIKGESIDGRLVMAAIDCPSRTDQLFNQYDYHPLHQLSRCTLPDYGILCVSEFVLDYMHLVCLGVTRRMLAFMKERPRLCKLSQQQLLFLSNNLENIKGKIPSDFARQPRHLDELKRWKPTEFHQFLLYTGLVFLKDVLSQKSFEHFLSLSVSIRIMVAHYKNEELLEYSKELLSWFVKNAAHFYGPYFTVYNVHNLIHLHDDVNYHKMSLFDMSAFAFENYMQTLKRYIRKSTELVVQVVNRRCEIDKTNSV